MDLLGWDGLFNLLATHLLLLVLTSLAMCGATKTRIFGFKCDHVSLVELFDGCEAAAIVVVFGHKLVEDVGSVKTGDLLKVNCISLDHVFHGKTEGDSIISTDEHIAERGLETVVLYIEEDLLLRGVHQSEGVAQNGVFGEAGFDCFSEAALVGSDVDGDSLLVGVGAGNVHPLAGLDNSIATLQDQGLSLEQVVRHVQVNLSAPGSFLGSSLMACGVGVASNKDALIINCHFIFLGVRGCSPLEVEDVVLHEFPVFSQVFGDVELFVNLAGLI